MTSRRLAALASLALLGSPIAAAAQGSELGQREYMNSCAQCHGADGRGQGVMAGFVTGSMPDLSLLQKNNGGVFPFASLYGIIDGTGTKGVHGSSDMPAWGMRYKAQAPAMLGDYYSPSDQDAFVRGRILALIEYISTLQQK